MNEIRDLLAIGLSMWAVMAITVAAVAAAELYRQHRARRDAAELQELERLSATLPEERDEVTPPDAIALDVTGATVVLVQELVTDPEPTPIYDRLVAEWDTLQAARIRALREPTAAFWALVQATDWTCEHCTSGDHLLCPGCECGCTLVGLELAEAHSAPCAPPHHARRTGQQGAAARNRHHRNRPSPPHPGLKP